MSVAACGAGGDGQLATAGAPFSTDDQQTTLLATDFCGACGERSALSGRAQPLSRRRRSVIDRVGYSPKAGTDQREAQNPPTGVMRTLAMEDPLELATRPRLRGAARVSFWAFGNRLAHVGARVCHYSGLW